MKTNTIKNTKVFTDEEVAVMDSLINEVSAKYNGWYGLEFEDLHSQLWAEAMRFSNLDNFMENRGTTVNSLKRKAISMVRKASLRYSTQIPSNFVEANSVDNEKSKLTPGSAVSSSEVSAWYNGSSHMGDDFNIYDILSVFTEGSREHIYVSLLMLEMGFVDTYKGMSYEQTFGVVKDSELLSAKGSTRDMLISDKMGFASSSSSAYKSTKYKVRKKLSVILGLDFD